MIYDNPKIDWYGWGDDGSPESMPCGVQITDQDGEMLDIEVNGDMAMVHSWNTKNSHGPDSPYFPWKILKELFEKIDERMAKRFPTQEETQ